MAATVVWIHHYWAIIALSLSALLTVIILLIFCVCWDYKRKRFKNMYMFNTTIPGINTKQPKLSLLVTPNIVLSEEDKRAPDSPDSDEVDTRSFDQVQLVIEDTDVDAVSCISGESMNSFFSAGQSK